MKSKIIIISGIIILLCYSACDKELVEIELTLNEKLNFDDSEYWASIKELFELKSSPNIITDSLIQYHDTLKSFYLADNFQPVFIKSFEESSFIDSLLTMFDNAGEHGLNPEQYHNKLIGKEFNKSLDSLEYPYRYIHLANTELLVCDAILKYSYHLRYGITNPKKVFPNDYFLPVVDSSKRDLFEPLHQKNIIKYLNAIPPKSKRYKDLQKALKRYESYKNFEWPSIPFQNKKIETGDKDTLLTPIINRLVILGFINTSKNKILDFTTYDSLVTSAVKHFQRLNGLNDDGVIGKNTIDKLNVTPQEYIEKIKLNLERFRWNNYSDSTRYVLVNIPDFRLFIYENGKEIFTSKVCVGRRRPSNYNKRLEKFKKTKHWEDIPDDWQTPITSGELSYIVLNPTWSVPESIIREEIFQKVSEDSNYLADHNFRVYSDTAEVDPSKVTLDELSAEDIQYKIVQGPGAGNALGKIKFIFYNRFGIYLHDTPTRQPFKYSNRAVSHGCIRVENPMPMAAFLLEDHPKWNIDFLKIEIGQKVEDKSKIAEYKKIRDKLRKEVKDEKTTEVYLSRKVPLFIDYFTAWVDENGEINFREDVYGKDKILMDYLLTSTQFKLSYSAGIF